MADLTGLENLNCIQELIPLLQVYNIVKSWIGEEEMRCPATEPEEDTSSGT